MYNTAPGRNCSCEIHNTSRVSCQTGPTRHAYAWQIWSFWQDTLDIPSTLTLHSVWWNNVQNITLLTAPCDTVVTHITIKSPHAPDILPSSSKNRYYVCRWTISVTNLLCWRYKQCNTTAKLRCHCKLGKYFLQLTNAPGMFAYQIRQMCCNGIKVFWKKKPKLFRRKPVP